MRLEDWGFVGRVLSPYHPPETAVQCVVGRIYGHTKFEDGRYITTSQIIHKEPGSVQTSSGSNYELGCIHPDYLKAYPEAIKYQGIKKAQ